MEPWLTVSGIAIVIVMILLACILWKVAKLILIPIQILLFLALIFIVYKLLFSTGNLNDLPAKIKDGNIQGIVDQAAGSASRFIKKSAADNNGAGVPAAADSGAKTDGPQEAGPR